MAEPTTDGTAWWRSVTAKMMVGTLLLVVPTLLAGMWMALAQHRHLEMEQVEGDVEHVADAVRQALEYVSPLAGSVHQRHIERALGDLEFVDNVRVVATDGAVVYSRIESEVGQTLRPEATQPCAHCHTQPGAPPAADDVVFESPDGRPIYHEIFTIPNQAMCHRCHVPDLDELGLLLISFDVSHAYEELRQFKRSSTLTILVAMVVLMGGIAVLFGRLVGRPLKRIGQDIGRVHQGDFDLGEPPSTPDQLGELHRTIVEMASELGDSRDRLEERVRRGSARVDDLTRRLQTISADLARLERLSALGALSAKVVHEVRTPLNALSMNVQLIRRMLRQGPAHQDSVLELIDNAHREIERISSVLTRFMERARVPKPTWSTENVDELVGGVLMLLTADANQRGVGLGYSVDESLGSLYVPGDAIRQILINLVTNAANASSSGSEVVVEVKAAGEELLRIQVIDQGIGIAPDDIERVLEPFYTTTEGGTGLGLAVVTQLVDQMGGTLAIESEEGRGTRAVVELPLSSPVEERDG